MRRPHEPPRAWSDGKKRGSGRRVEAMSAVGRGRGCEDLAAMGDAASDRYDVRRGAVEDVPAVHEVRQRAIRESAAGLYDAVALEAWASGGSEDARLASSPRTGARSSIVSIRPPRWAGSLRPRSPSPGPPRRRADDSLPVKRVAEETPQGGADIWLIEALASRPVQDTDTELVGPTTSGGGHRHYSRFAPTSVQYGRRTHRIGLGCYLPGAFVRTTVTGGGSGNARSSPKRTARYGPAGSGGIRYPGRQGGREGVARDGVPRQVL